MPDIVVTVAIPHLEGSLLRSANLAALVEVLSYGARWPVSVVLDVGKGGLETVERCWRRGLTLGGTHHLVLDDDATLCPGFAGRLVQAISEKPNDILCLFTGSQSLMDRARQKGEHWISHPAATGGVGICMPLSDVGQMMARTWGTYHTGDGLVTAYALTHDRAVWHTAPSLVDHNTDLGPAQDGGRHNTRRAAWFAADATE